MFLTPEQIEALAADPAISAIQLDELSAPQTDGTIPLIGASALHSSGFTGSGVAIAILDTGVDHEHPMFSGRIVESLCFSSNVTDQSTSLCAGGVESDTSSADAGDDCAYTGDTETAITGCGHGTHVAGTAAGASWVDPGTGDTLIGVAPAANIIAIQVFSRFTGLCAGFGYSSPCALTYTSDQIAALDWLLTNHATYNVASANMSLGGGNYSSYCNADSRYTVINDLRAAGVATAIASGNSGYNSAVGAPACIEPAITVGATDNADNVASFSNSASMIDLLAPGVAINSAEPTVDDTPPGRARSIQGTSMATPHVAGAFALLRSAVPGASVAAIEFALESTGVSVTESPSNLIRPRIQVDSAYGAMDTTAPRIASITRQTPASSPTNSDSVTWRVTFNEAVQNVSADDFTHSGTTATLGINNVSATQTDVTLSAGDLTNLNATVTLGFNGAQNITDLSGNALTNTTPTGTNNNTFLIDNTAPTLTAFTRNTPSGSPTNADSLVFGISFNEAVQNVSADDFVIVGTTATGTIGGSGSAYTLTLSGGDLANLNGSVQLNLSVSHDIVDQVGIALPNTQPVSEEFYTLDNNLPSLTSFTRQTPSTEQTNADTLVFQALFSEAVTNLDASDFTVSGTTAIVTDVSIPEPAVSLDAPMVTGILAHITVSGGDLANLNGTVGLNLAGGQNITDEAGNALPGGEPATDQTFTLVNDVTPPTVLFVGRQVPSGELAFGSSVTWRVAFSEAVARVDAGDFSVSNTTAGLTVTTVSSQIFDVTASGGNFGSVGAIVALSFAEGASITDAAGNAAVNFVPTAFNVNTFDVDNAQPVPTLTAPGTVGGLSPFNVTVTFNETVHFFNEPGELSAYNATVAAPVGSGSNYTVQVTPTGGGDILLRVNGNAVLDRTFVNTNVPSDLVTITYDTTGPTISSIARLSPVTELTNADALTWRVTFNETIGAIAPSDFVVSGTTATVQSVSAPAGNARLDAGSSGSTFYDVRISGGDLADMANGTVSISLSGGQAIADIYGNVLTNTTPTGANDNSYTIRNPDPTLITASVSPGVINAYQGGPSVALFGAIYASSQAAAEGCTISFPDGVPATMTYQLTENGSPVGAVNPVFTVPAGTTLTYAMTVTPTTQTGTEGVDFFPVFACFNATADTIRGFNSLRLNVGASAPPRVISFPFSSTFDGVVRIPSSGGLGIMSTIAVNIGEGDGSGANKATRMTVSVDTGNAALPVSSLQICQTNPGTGGCTSPLGANVTSDWAYYLTHSYGIFVYDNGATGIPFDPANARLFVRYAAANGVVRAIDSLPITSPAPVAALASEASTVEPGRYSVSLRMPDGEWPNLQQRTLFVQPDGMAIIGGEQPRLVSLADAVEHTSLAFSPNSIRYDIADGREPGEFWGIRDHRSDEAIGDPEAPDSFGSADSRSSLYLGADGHLSGIVDGCMAGGRMSAPAEAASGLSFGYVELVSCEAAGVYRTVIDTAANDNAPVYLLIAHETGGWRLAGQ